uniref:alpha-L-fucosidase n=1 Tax=Chenopodium quinoa TaxID=63459 RepID=A0A803M0N6_CHEQI
MANVCIPLYFLLLLIHLFGFIIPTTSLQKPAIPPPLPILPLPSYSQLKWQQREIIMFFHFGVNTFTDSEWGTGHESPAVFNPTRLNPDQWFRVAAEAGISLAILTAKHHDGFCLWPSKYTDHSVAQSPWKQGHGDVVQEFVTAAKAHGIDAGLYLSPWDRHDKRYGNEKAYNEYYLAQLQELLTRYGGIKEIWFDGAKGSNAPNMSYYFWDWFAMVKELQSSINIFSDAGPDVRWVGNEKGFAGNTCWSTIKRTWLSIGNASIVDYLSTGDSEGTDWLPPECDVSIRPGWFWHKSEEPKKLSELLEIYYNSDHLWTYWAPSEDDKEDKWIEIRADNQGLRFNVIMIQEAIGLGQRIQQHEIYVDGKQVAKGTTVGYKRLHWLGVGGVHAKRVKIRVVKSRDLPLISSVGLFLDPYNHPNEI